MTKLSCCMIVRDEESTLRRCLESIRPHVDELVVVDTGSEDGTLALAKEFADKCETFTDCNNPQTGLIEDFAMARNRSLELASGDWWCWFDGDDEIRGGEHLRQLCEQNEWSAHALISFRYEYDHDPEGRCTELQWRERLMRPRSGWHWVMPVHEGPVLNVPASTMAQDPSDLVTVVHRHEHSTRKREQGRNLRILKRYCEKAGEGDHRALHHLGMEYALEGQNAFNVGNVALGMKYIGAAVRTLRRHVEIGAMDDERALSELALARIALAQHDYDVAVQWANRATLEKSWPTGPFLLGRIFYEMAKTAELEPYKNLARAVHWFNIGLALPDPATLLSYRPLERAQVHEYLGVALAQLGRLDDAIRSCEMGLVALPENKLLQANLKAFQRKAARDQVSGVLERAGFDQTKRQFVEDMLNDGIELKTITQADLGQGGDALQQPFGHAGDAAANGRVIRSARKPSSPHGLDVVIYCGHGFEPWSPETIARQGIGGSETMAWEVARGLVRLGHAVRVYGHHGPGAPAGTFEGVEFIDSAEFKHIECDVLIASRRPDAVDSVHDCQARIRVLWVHDVHCGELLSMQRDVRFDAIVCLTDWHKGYFQKCYPRCNPRKIRVVRNGVDVEAFMAARVERSPTPRLIYSSSPDRGLAILLELWPRIREQVPDAELHCFYGFENWEKAVRGAADSEGLAHLNRVKALIVQHSGRGVVMHGRVSPAELAREFHRSWVWAYPSWHTPTDSPFCETSCITAMQAQLAGLNIVTVPWGGLAETVIPGFGIWRVDTNDPNGKLGHQWRTDFAANIVRALRQHIEIRHELTPPSAAEGVFVVPIRQWDAMLRELVGDTGEIVMPEFHSVCAEELVEAVSQ